MKSQKITIKYIKKINRLLGSTFIVLFTDGKKLTWLVADAPDYIKNAYLKQKKVYR